MIQNLLHPYSATILVATALFGVVAFTVTKVIATVPASALNIPSHTIVAHTVSNESYIGIVSWVTKNSLSITDSYGVSRVFDIQDSTQILKGTDQGGRQHYNDIHIFDHVRVTTLKDGLEESAQVITIQ